MRFLFKTLFFNLFSFSDSQVLQLIFLPGLKPVAHLRNAAHALYADNGQGGGAGTEGGKDSADRADAGGIERSPETGAGVFSGGGAGGEDF